MRVTKIEKNLKFKTISLIPSNRGHTFQKKTQRRMPGNCDFRPSSYFDQLMAIIAKNHGLQKFDLVQYGILCQNSKAHMNFEVRVCVCATYKIFWPTSAGHRD